MKMYFIWKLSELRYDLDIKIKMGPAFLFFHVNCGFEAKQLT